jgi:hypothetical protein
MPGARDANRPAQRDATAQPCSLSHFAMKLVFAAPLSGLPSDPMALGAHASRLHLVMKAVRAAPESSRPSFPTALLAHVSGACAAAEPIANAVSKPAIIHRVIVTSREITSPRPAATAHIQSAWPGRGSMDWRSHARSARSTTSRQQAHLAGLDLQREIFRVDAALGEAAGDEPKARLRGSREHVAQLLSVAESPNRTNAASNVVAE